MIKAATLLLLRDTSDGVEVFMLQRHHKIKFAGGALVFPGGKLDPADGDESLRDFCDGAEGLSNEALATRICAIRETFEESGYLLARREGSGDLLAMAEVEALAHEREALHDGKRDLRSLLAASSLRLACDQLVPYAHWITPKPAPRQYDTHFFLASVPKTQRGTHDGVESIASHWARPEDFLQQAQNGDVTIIFPTRMNLHRLHTANTTQEAIAASKAQPIVTVRPWFEEREGGGVICIPTGAGYDTTEDALERVMREEGIEFGGGTGS